MSETMKYAETMSGMWPYMHHLHWIFILLLLVGVVTLTVWAVKYLKAKELKIFSITLLIIAAIGMLLTSAFAMPFAHMGYRSGDQAIMMKYMYDTYEKGDKVKAPAKEDRMERMAEEMEEMMGGDEKTE